MQCIRVHPNVLCSCLSPGLTEGRPVWPLTLLLSWIGDLLLANWGSSGSLKLLSLSKYMNRSLITGWLRYFLQEQYK